MTPRPLILDVTRTLSRIGLGGESGVDRVERAYLDEVRARDPGALFLARIAGGAALLDGAGMTRLLDAPLPSPDLIGRISLRQNPARRRAETLVRRLALGWARHRGLPALLQRHAKPGFVYLNTGHTNLERDRLLALRAGGAGAIVALIHDVIPLEYPEFSRAEAPERLRRLLAAISAEADLVIFNSADTDRRAEVHLKAAGRVPPSVTALLGVDPPKSVPNRAPAHPPEFLMLGTIEPRKNHLLPLALWREFHETLPPDACPHLHIVGRRGWENGNVFAILDRAPMMGKTVFEHGHLSDDEVDMRMSRASALLFPSHAEGFGYPLAEALLRGVPTLCTDLAVFREIAGETPTYIKANDGPGWKDAILRRSQSSLGEPVPKCDLPKWSEHFAAVFDEITKCCVSTNEKRHLNGRRSANEPGPAAG